MTPRDTNADSTATAQESVRSSITVPPDIIVGLLGSADENLRAIEKVLTSDVHVRGNEVTFSGEPADVRSPSAWWPSWSPWHRADRP